MSRTFVFRRCFWCLLFVIILARKGFTVMFELWLLTMEAMKVVFPQAWMICLRGVAWILWSVVPFPFSLSIFLSACWVRRAFHLQLHQCGKSSFSSFLLYLWLRKRFIFMHLNWHASRFGVEPLVSRQQRQTAFSVATCLHRALRTTGVKKSSNCSLIAKFSNTCVQASTMAKDRPL